MITIAWYNVVAIIAGILFIWEISKINPDGRYGIDGIIIGFWLACAILFYAIWGGIFWW